MATNAHTQPQQQQQQNVGVPYIGSKISLISKKDIRYEGILFNIDTKEASVALQTVRSFGTEGRRPLHENVPPSDTVFDYVIFRGADIKDLHVCEAPQQSLPDDPAIISSQTAPAPPQQVSPAAGSLPTPPPSASILSTNSSNSLSASAAVAPQSNTRDPNYGVQDAEEDMKTMNLDGNADGSNSKGAQRRRGGRTGGQQNSGPRAARTIPGMGNHLLGRRERGVKEEKAPEECTHEFDFEEQLGEFDKEKEYSILNTEETSSTKQNMAYNKSSFFDNISCDALDRLEGNSGRMRASEERKLNTETFGAIGLNNRRNYRGRGRGYRNRGGRRGGRGYRGGRGGRGGSRDNRGRDDQGGRSVSHD